MCRGSKPGSSILQSVAMTYGQVACPMFYQKVSDMRLPWLRSHGHLTVN